MRSWACDETGLTADQFLLGTTFPRRVYDAADDRKMIDELGGLCPSATLVVTVIVAPNDAVGFTSSLYAAAAYTASTVRAVAAAVAGWLPAGSPLAPHGEAAQRRGVRQNGQAAAGGGQPVSMAEMRRREGAPAGGGGLAYDNGNSTQFSAEGGSDGEDDALPPSGRNS